VKFCQTNDPCSDIWPSPYFGHVRHGSACKISRPYVVQFRSYWR